MCSRWLARSHSGVHCMGGAIKVDSFCVRLAAGSLEIRRFQSLSMQSILLSPNATTKPLLHARLARYTSLPSIRKPRQNQMNPITMKDIAQACGVSIITVSKAMRGRPDIGAETRKRVLAKAKELNYRPNLTARSLVTGQSRQVGVIVPTLLHPFFA